MVMNGWDYKHTTYVDDKNTRVGDYVDFGKGRTQVGQAYEVAAWLFKQNRAWTDPGKGDWQPGDLLFWSHPDPEGAGTTGVYFANVHHVALYIGDNKVVHSWGVASGAGVVEEPVTDLMRDKVTLVGRPNWFDFTGNADGGSKTPASSQRIARRRSPRQCGGDPDVLRDAHRPGTRHSGIGGCALVGV